LHLRPPAGRRVAIRNARYPRYGVALVFSTNFSSLHDSNWRSAGGWKGLHR